MKPQAGGRAITTRYLLTAIGMLSAPTMPTLEGVEDFEDESFHTYNWPHEPMELIGKRVAVIRTGATDVQVILEIDDKTQAEIKTSYPEIFERCSETPGGFIHGPDRRKVLDVSEEERLEFWEDLYASPGSGVWLGNFRDVLVDEKANEEFTAFIADKIRGRVNNPETAEKLIPADHGFGTRRVSLETRYYEAYNRDNVHLIDINETPIERITSRGVRTSDKEYEFDLIVYATGFDAITGPFDPIDFIGVDDQKLRDKWADRPVTYLGVQTEGFPNMLTFAGPQGGSVSTNFPRGIEQGVDWATKLIVHMKEHGYSRIEPTTEAEDEWSDHVKDMYGGLLLSKAKSWFTGFNTNVKGHDKPRYLIYNGGAPRYRKRLTEVVENDYEEFVMD